MKRQRGFSMVELIIVIAIMAILAGALAPALIKYIKRARRVRDVDTAKEIRLSVERLIIDEDPGSSTQYELYPDYQDFLDGKKLVL